MKRSREVDRWWWSNILPPRILTHRREKSANKQRSKGESVDRIERIATAIEALTHHVRLLAVLDAMENKGAKLKLGVYDMPGDPDRWPVGDVRVTPGMAKRIREVLLEDAGAEFDRLGMRLFAVGEADPSELRVVPGWVMPRPPGPEARPCAAKLLDGGWGLYWSNDGYEDPGEEIKWPFPEGFEATAADMERLGFVVVT